MVRLAILRHKQNAGMLPPQLQGGPEVFGTFQVLIFAELRMVVG